MAKHGRFIFWISASVFASVAVAFPSSAQPRPAQGDCRAMSASYGADKIWWGRFSGGKEIMGFGDSDPIVVQTYEACFTSQKSCEAWLYELKSEYNIQPRWNQCDRGYRSGAQLKPWYQRQK